MVMICGILLVAVPVFYTISNKLLLGTIIELETRYIKTDLKRVIYALEKELQGLEATGGDWGAWDETRDFINNHNRSYIEDNLGAETLSNLSLNFMVFYDISGNIVHSTGVEYNDVEKEIPVSEALINEIRNQKNILTHRHASDAKTGVILIPEDIALITAWPISNNEMEGPVSGTLVMGRYLGDDEVKSLEEQTQLDVAFYRAGDSHSPDDIIAAKSELARGNEVAINRNHAETISAYGFFKDIDGNDSLVLKVRSQRDIFRYGKAGINYFRVAHLVVGISLLSVIFLTLRALVIKPIFNLKRHALSVGRSGDLSARLSLKNRDEIGELSREFDRMLEQLSDARNRLMEQSYYSGIGEMASGVLHNIRNILTPMVGQIDKIKERINDAPVHNMEQAMIELNTGNPEEERERALKRYLQLACSRMGSDCTDINNSITIVLEQAAHMEAVLSLHNKSGMFKKALEPLGVYGIVNEAVNLMPEGLRDAVDIEMETDLAELPQVYAERISLIQVFTNLLNNSSESILRKGLKKGNIWISGISGMEGDVQKVHIIIRDNGEGIDRDNLKKIFNRGYSTKVPKSAGIGLHWSGNALSAMNAEFYVESEGTGHGCSFHIKLPAFNN